MGIFSRNRKLKNYSDEILILYASKSGNAKLIAQQAFIYYQKNGLKPTCANMAKYPPDNLEGINKLVAVVSTDGEGDPPPGADKFFKKIVSPQMPSLRNLHYAVCALGDSSYEKYCEAGKYIDRRLEELEANRVMDRVDCDTEFAQPAAQWIKNSFVKLQNGHARLNGEGSSETLINGKKEYTGSLVHREQISGGKDSMPCYHLEMETIDAPFHFQPGDSIELKPENPVWLVNEILKACRVKPEIMVSPNLSVSGMLLKEREITRVSAATLKKYAAKSNNPALKELLGNPGELSAFSPRASFLDVLQKYPGGLSAEDITDILPVMKYRQYSIASAPVIGPKGRVDLLVKKINEEKSGRIIMGAASNYLCETIVPGQPFKFRHYKSKNFHLPENRGLPLIMICAGTGIAPFRAFLHQLSAENATNKKWLLFGEKRRGNNFLYKEELLQYRNKGTLDELDTAFSRDQDQKVYVQDVLQQKSSRFIAWINEGAHVYVCGPLAMGKSVKQCIQSILGLQKDGIATMKKLTDAGRYHEDIY